MRNRVSFSYVGKYDISYQTYSNTIFFDYCKEESHDTGDIYKDKVKYTYIGKPSWAYVHHDVGTSYAHIDDNTEKITLYENEYDRQKYVIIDSNQSDKDNNQKEIIRKSINVNNPSQELPIQESICTYINISNIPGASYTMFPNFVEGITGYEYQIYKLAYGVSTNSMAADGPVLNVGDYNGLTLKYGDKDVSYNIRGTYKTSNNEYVRINGVGFEVMTGDTILMSGAEYINVLKIYVYDENNNLIKNTELYSALSVTLPGVESNAYNTNVTNDGVYLSINASNKHVGMLLIKMTLNWKNNKFTVYHNFNFGAVVDKLNNISDLNYAINNYAASNVSQRRNVLLEGDKINIAYLKTNPERANGKIELSIIDITMISSAYIGTNEKNDSSNKLREYDFSGRTIKQVINSQNGIYKVLENTIKYNYENNVPQKTQQYPINVYRFIPNSSSIKFSYKTQNNTYIDFPSGTTSVGISEGKNNIFAKFNIACSDNVNQAKYKYKLNRDGNYNNFDVKLNYQSGINNPDASNSIQITTDDNLKFNTTLSYNYCEFSYNVSEPGKYTFFYSSKNGNVTHSGELKTFEYSQLNDLGSKTIITYEGAFAYNLLDDNSYNVNINSLTQKTLGNYNVNLSNFTFGNWQYNYAYHDIDIDDCTINMGLMTNAKYPIDLNNDNEFNNADVNALITFVNSGNSSEFIDYFDYNNDGVIDSDDYSALNNESFNKNRIAPIKIANAQVGTLYDELFRLNFVSDTNNYKQIVSNYNIFVRKFSVTTKVRVKTSLNGSVSEYIIGTFTFPNNNQIEVNRTFLDLVNYNSNDIYFDIISTVHLLPTNETQDPCSYVKLNVTSTDWDFNWIDYSDNDAQPDQEVTTSFKIRKNNWNYGISNPLCLYSLKLDRKPVGEYSTEYWDALGFENATLNFKFNIVNSHQQAEQSDVPSMLLFTNVVDAETETNSCKYIYINDVHGAPISSVEKLNVYDSEGNKFELSDLHNMGLNVTYEIDEATGGAAIVFTPVHNNTPNFYRVYNFKVAPEQHEENKSDFIVILRSADIDIADISNRKYIIDTTDSSKILYQEILLSGSNQSTFYNDNIFISHFCGIENISSGNNMLNYYELKSDLNGNYIILHIKTNIWYNYNNQNYSANVMLNTPNGIKYTIECNNLLYDKTEKVLIPTTTGTATVTLKHNNLSVVSKQITMEQIAVEHYKLFTNGAENTSNPTMN